MKHYKKVRTLKKPWYVDSKNESDFAPYFDFGDNPDIDFIESQFAYKPEADPALKISEACETWRNSGGVIVRMGFGVRSEWRGQIRETAKNVWVADGVRTYTTSSTHVSPEGCVLINQVARGDILNDFRFVLGVDEYWACGFHHAISQTHTLAGKIRKHFDSSEAYKKGFDVGLDIAANYVMILGGWQEPFHNRSS